ncbi:IclR family transcriptional regulator [Arthrobacter sp. NicSoilC5]|uniref:IclR family transcriptional regulator n=1 Tax=Arthrobacter sp. NicSoilC5 TaxID=2831000 RepID=UPI001CC62D5F|nr:IclR family transcriptional regulator [Arthrobacter sp. NicSoilC5]BCW78354.1 IclR family transcriptional regulator [Arthrobacter sp. NicSoilC5]
MSAAKSGTDSARRALDLLFAFEKMPMATVRELSDQTQMPLPTAHRYVAMLREMGLIEEARHGTYRLTMRMASLGQAARQATSLIDLVHPFMQALSDEVEETVLLVQPVAGLPVCTHRVEAKRRLRLSFEVGQHMPALRGASPRLLLASQPEDRRRAYIEEALARGELAPVAGVDELLAEVREDAARGWAISKEEIDEGVWSAAALIRSEGKPIGTLSAPCPIFRLDEDRADTLLKAVTDSARKISTALGS